MNKPIHRQKQVIVNGKKSLVDIGIIPLVKFTNRFSGVKTTYSCEGDKIVGKVETHLPYIRFKCSNPKSLLNIKILLKNFSNSLKINDVSFDEQTDFKNGKEYVYYGYSFPTHIVMKKFIKYAAKARLYL